MSTTFQPRAEVIHGDCLTVMRGMAAGSVDAVVTDAPYDLAFMGKAWDRSGVAFDPATWTEVLRVLKPGGHLLAFGGSRTYHRMACAVEDAGFEVRDCLAWLYGVGFPKSHNLHGEWQGWGTALKPAYEPIILARKPLSERNVAANVKRWGTGALNVDGCRIPTDDNLNGGAYTQGASPRWDGTENWRYKRGQAGEFAQPTGRWPANVALDEEAAAALDEQSGTRPGMKPRVLQRGLTTGSGIGYGSGSGPQEAPAGYGDTGGASRFFYTAKADAADRGPGNNHPTVKPTDLMRWLCRLVTPPGGTILDPFGGSGSTIVAAAMEGFHSIGIEQDEGYCAIARRRAAAAAQPRMALFEARG